MSDSLRPAADSVQRLMRALVVEDAAQEAWLTALRKGLSGPGLGHWIREASQRIARSIHRAEARRRDHETRASRTEADPSTLETAVRLELVRRVMTVVEEL